MKSKRSAKPKRQPAQKVHLASCPPNAANCPHGTATFTVIGGKPEPVECLCDPGFGYPDQKLLLDKLGGMKLEEQCTYVVCCIRIADGGISCVIPSAGP